MKILLHQFPFGEIFRFLFSSNLPFNASKKLVQGPHTILLKRDLFAGLVFIG
jgi:hypothetical protein